ncbi:MAG: polysaccharide deacetylase family protein [Caldilineaceae bacterium]|nr:polysaccharide deacetylase family protein [Caldilineaceae bacterium]
MPGTMLIGYDVEWQSQEGNVTEHFLATAQPLHQRLNVPTTFFIVGQTLKRCAAHFQAVKDDPLIDLQQHTYSHQLLKTVYIDDGKSIRVKRGIEPEETRIEVRKTTELLKEYLDVDCIGLTGPWNYYRGLRDRPDLLQILHEEGIRFMRMDGRNAQDWHPVEMDLQPYWLDDLGFPDMFEMLIHGWHDCVIRQERFGWENLTDWVDSVKPYIDRAAAEDKVFSLCQHDWSSTRADPTMSATEAIIRYGQEKGLRFMTYRAYYEECKAKRSAEAIGQPRFI